MNPVEPKLRGGQIHRVAETQPEFQPVTVIQADNPNYQEIAGHRNTVIMAFGFSAKERKRIIDGESTIYVGLLTFGRPQQGIILTVGPEEIADIHGLEVVRPDPETYPTSSEGPE